MSLAREIMQDVRHVSRHLGHLRQLLNDTALYPHERIQIMANLDVLTASVGNLETAAAAAVAEIATLTSGSDEAALGALATRIDTVTANLTAAAVPSAPAA